MSPKDCSQNSGKPGRKGIFGFLLLVLLIIAVWLGFLSKEFEEVKFESDAVKKSLTALGALSIIALFVERVQEVHISAWRKLGREKIDAKIAQLKEEIAQNPDNKKDDHEALMNLQKSFLEYRHETRQMTLFFSMLLGMLISFAGPRILVEIVTITVTECQKVKEGLQYGVFSCMDILITSGLIAGGADGIHNLISRITKYKSPNT